MEGLVKSFGHAAKGLRLVIKSERNARLHLVLAVIAIIWAIALHFSAVAITLVVLAIATVIAAEVFNTVIEKLLNVVDPNHNPRVAEIKDMAAGAVLITALAALAIGIILFVPAIRGH